MRGCDVLCECSTATGAKSVLFASLLLRAVASGQPSRAHTRVAGQPPPVPPAPPNACPLYHTGRKQYDPSGPILMPDGTWHMFPDGGGWAHYTSTDLIHWRTDYPTTNFDGDTGAITATPAGMFALWPTKNGEGCGHGNQPGDNISLPGICMATTTDPTLETFKHRGIVGVPPPGTSIQDFRDPGRALRLKTGWYVPAGVDVPLAANVSGCSGGESWTNGAKCGGINWFRATNDSMTRLEHTGFLLTSKGITMMECPGKYTLIFTRAAGRLSSRIVSSHDSAWSRKPDVFELDGKIVILVGAGGYTQYWVGSISDDDLTFLEEYSEKLDFGKTSISSIYAAKTGTEARPPYTRRVAFGFSGWGDGEISGCASWYVLPRDLSISSLTGKLLQHPARELTGLRKQELVYPAIAHGAQVELLVQCAVPNPLPLSGVVAFNTLRAHNQSGVQIGYNFTNRSAIGFSHVPASLSALGARTDVAPVYFTPNRSVFELRTFIDGHMVETFYGGDAVITTITSNVVASTSISSQFINTARCDCNVTSWVLGL